MIYLNKILFPVKNCDWIFKIENFLSKDIYNNLSKEIIEESIFLEGDGKKSIGSNNDNFYKYSSKKTHLNSFLAEVKKKTFQDYLIKNLYYKIVKHKLDYKKKLYLFNFLFRNFFDNVETTVEISHILNNNNLKAHVDSDNKLLTMMLYFPQLDEVENSFLVSQEKKLGTTFYDNRKKNYKNEHIDYNIMTKDSAKEIYTPEFEKYHLFGFIKHSRSWHSLKKFNIQPNYRRVSININLKLVLNKPFKINF